MTVYAWYSVEEWGQVLSLGNKKGLSVPRILASRIRATPFSAFSSNHVNQFPRLLRNSKWTLLFNSYLHQRPCCFMTTSGHRDLFFLKCYKCMDYDTKFAFIMYSVHSFSVFVNKGMSFGLGHDLVVAEFKPCVRFYADSAELGACFGFCVSLSVCPSPAQG